MKIITRGIPPKERIYRHTCTTCKTVFEFAQSEGKIYNDQRDGDYILISCPVCNATCEPGLNAWINKTGTIY